MKFPHLIVLFSVFIIVACAPSEMEIEQLEFDKDSRSVCECVKESANDQKKLDDCAAEAELIMYKWKNKPRRAAGLKRRVEECLSIK